MIENGSGTQCRLCTSTAVGQIVEIFGEDGRTRNLAKKIEECLPISVARGDLFPKTVCLLCLDKLEQFHVFRESCIKSELCFEAKWKELHPHQNIQFPLEPECCLQEVDNETAPIVSPPPPVVSKHPTPEGLFRLEIIPQYNVPKKTDLGPSGFNLSSISPNNFKQNHFKTSTPIQRTYGSVRQPSNLPSPLHASPHPRIGLPNPDDYILVQEETIALDNDATKNSNNLVEFHDAGGKGGEAGGKDLDIILEQKRRHAILPPMWDVYEKIITVGAEEKRNRVRVPNGIEGLHTAKPGAKVDDNENSILEDMTDGSSKDNTQEPPCESPPMQESDRCEDGRAIKTEPRSDDSENSRTESALIDSAEPSMQQQVEKSDKPALKIIHRRYIISKEAFPCSLCGNCFLVNQGFERETAPPDSFHQHGSSSYENDINYLNNTPEDRKLYNMVRMQNNPMQWPAVEISRKYSPPIMPVTKNNKPNIALTARKNGPIGFDAYKKPVMKKLMPFAQVTPVPAPIAAPSPPKVATPPEFTQTVVNTKHQFVSQLIKREPVANEEGVSVTSEDIDDFNSLVIKNFYCEICNKYFPRRSSLKRHQRTHASDKVFSCPRCSKAFSRKEHLSRHMLLHTEVRPFQCQVCMKKYTRKEHVERHILIHPQVPEQEFRMRKFDKQMCRELDSEARHYASLGIFKGRGGVGGTVKLERPYVCELCNHGFARREHLQRHKKRMHRVTTGKVEGGGPGTDESKPYSCPKCLKTFTRKEHLVRHNKIHLREVVLRTGQIPPGLNLLPAMLQLPPKSLMGGHVRPALSITRAPDIAPARLPCDRLPGLDVSLSVIEAKKPPASKEIPLIPNKLDISISLVKEAPQPPSTSNGPIRVKQELAPKKFQLPVPMPDKMATESVPEPIPAPNISHLGTSEEHLMNFLKPFNCEYCTNKRFTRKSHLVRHFKRIHPERDASLVGGPGELKSEPVEFDSDTFVSNNDEHLCKICNKNFSRRYHLNRHLKLHLLDKSGKLKEIEDDANKPFKCSSCNERFAKYEGFQTHRCTGTEVGSMVLVGIAELAGGSEAGSTASSADTVTECKLPKSTNNSPLKENLEGRVPGTSKGKNESMKNSLGIHTMISKITLKRNSAGGAPGSGANPTGKNPAKRDRRKVSRNCYECEVCGANFALKKLVNKHMLTHGIDVENESDCGGGEGGENVDGSTSIPQ